jgi:hypothetical protein
MLLLILVVLLRGTVAFAVNAALELLAESAVEERLAETAGVILAGPVRAAGALADPALNCVVSDPDGDPPDVLIQIWFSISGSCQYCGATSMTT